MGRERDALLAAICHDLRAPLAAVMMGANFVLQSTPTAETSNRSRRVLEAMLRSCKQMERLVRDFGDLAEIEEGNIALRYAVATPEELLEVAAEAARAASNGRRVSIVVAPRPTPLAPLRCDRERILRALAHLLGNAVRCAPDDSEITLDAGEENGLVRLRVTDHGPGLSDETLAHLYDRNWHAARSGRAGAGLGLAIAHGFVLAHGGSIEVTTGSGAPTTFSLLIPREAPREEREPVKPPATRTARV
jgi:two-component system sensor histidine kinase BaeS